MHRTKSALFTAACAAAVIGAVALIAYFAHIMILQTSWKHGLEELDRAFIASRGETCVIARGGVEVEADESVLDYYLGVLTMPRTMATHYAPSDAGEGIELRLPGLTVTFSPYRDGVSTVVSWESGGESRGYVLGGTMDYVHLTRYFENTVRAAARNE